MEEVFANDRKFDTQFWFTSNKVYCFPSVFFAVNASVTSSIWWKIGSTFFVLDHVGTAKICGAFSILSNLVNFAERQRRLPYIYIYTVALKSIRTNTF
jgi:hypothetical protein